MGGIFSSAEVVTIFYRWYQIKEFCRYIEDIQYLGEVYDIPALKAGIKLAFRLNYILGISAPDESTS